MAKVQALGAVPARRHSRGLSRHRAGGARTARRCLTASPGAAARDAGCKGCLDRSGLGRAWRSRRPITVQIAALRRALGEHPGAVSAWIETLPRRGYRLCGPRDRGGSGCTSHGRRTWAPALALPDRPSIAVLPFQNMSGDTEQEYFVDGMVEDIITGLSRIEWLFVIARNSSFTFKGRAVDVKQVGRELGVRYVLEGSRARGRRRVRGSPRRWSRARPGRMSGPSATIVRFGDILEPQDEITFERGGGHRAEPAPGRD